MENGLKKEYLPLKILSYATFLQYLRFVMPVSFLFYLHNGLSFSEFILFQSIFNITCLISKIPMGALGDIFSKKNLLIFSYFLFLLRVILWIFFSGFWIILLGEILYGLFKALWRGNADSYIFEYLKKEGMEDEMTKKWGRNVLYTSLGSAISCLLGVLLYKYYGFKTILYLELITQIAAIILLFFIPNIKSFKKSRRISLIDSICDVIKNKKINFLTYYSAFLTGLTSIFVWNFQPLLKTSSAPILIYGVVNFINQFLRGLAGKFADSFIKKFNKVLVLVEYLSVIFSFILLIISLQLKNYIFSLISLVLISFAIFIFVIYNIYTISKIHQNTADYNRAATSSTVTFFGDFASFLFLLIFKYLYDNFGVINSMAVFFIISLIFLFPGGARIFNKSS